jgi:hypothetical protein
MRERAKKVARRDISSRHVRNFSMTADLEDERWRHILLPVYLAAYRFQGQVYQVMVNGQTGSIAGQKPVSWLRVGGALALLLLPALLLLLLSGLLPEDAASASAMIGLGALVIGVAVASRVLRQALAADDA